MEAVVTPDVILRQVQKTTPEVSPFLFSMDYSQCMVDHYLRKWRKFRGLTLNELADRMETEPGVQLISSVSLSRIERGLQPYSQPILEALAAALDVKRSDLLDTDPTKKGEVIDLLRIIDSMAPDKQKTIVAMVRAASVE